MNNTRLATLRDVAALRQLIALSARSLNREHYTPEQVESTLKYVYGVDTQLIYDQTYFVVEADGILVGCGGWSRRKNLYGGNQYKENTPNNLLDPTTDAARIRAFFVHPRWARKGVGSHLMRVCEQAAKEAGFRSLELMATLTGELLYERFGFKRVEEVETVLPDGTLLKTHRMRKPLD